jgi:hypothetical protein
MTTAEADLDDRVDLIHSRREAYLLYIDAAFHALTVSLGYKCGGAAEGHERTGEVVRFIAHRFDGQEFEIKVDRQLVERIAEQHEVDPAALIAMSLAAPGKYIPRWIGEKRAAAEVAEFAARRIPRVQRPAPPTSPQVTPSFAEFMRDDTRKET